MQPYKAEKQKGLTSFILFCSESSLSKHYSEKKKVRKCLSRTVELRVGPQVLKMSGNVEDKWGHF